MTSNPPHMEVFLINIVVVHLTKTDGFTTQILPIAKQTNKKKNKKKVSNWQMASFIDNYSPRWELATLSWVDILGSAQLLWTTSLQIKKAPGGILYDYTFM